MSKNGQQHLRRFNFSDNQFKKLVLKSTLVFRPGLLMVKRFDPLRKIPNRVETGLKIFNSVSYQFITGLTFILTDFKQIFNGF